jgi:hypothetical protein
MKLVILETANYTFHLAVKQSSSVKDIEKLLKAAMRKHAKQTGADLNFLLGIVDGGGYSIVDIKMNQVYRDKQTF